MSKERWEKRNRGPRDISPDERSAMVFVKALKRIYKSPKSLSTLPTTYSPASPREIYEVIQRAHSPQKDSED